MKSRILNKAVFILMIGIALAGTLISCDGAANAIPQDMEEVEVKASVIDETKSLEAYFGETVANDVTHYRWVMTHRNPTRVYDTGYVPRATAEAHQMFANMNGTHKILTGEYDWTFAGYVYDGAGSGDANYHKVAEVSNTGEIINARTQSVAIELNTLVGQNQGAEITAKIPVDFYNAYTANAGRLRLTVSATDATDGTPATITGDQGSLAATGTANQLKLTLGSLPTGSYRLTVQIDLLNEALTETVDSKTAVSVLRSVSGSVAKGEMNFASTTLNGMELSVQLVDVTGDAITAGATMDSYVIEGLNESYMNSTTADVTLNYPHVEGVSVKWYIDGVEAGADRISAVSTNGDDTTYTIQAGAIEEGDHILTATLINDNFNMSAGSVSFKVTVCETAPLPKGGMDTFRGKTYSYTNDAGEQRFVFFSKDLITAGKWKMVEGPVTPADGTDSDTRIDEIASQIATYGFTSPGYDFMVDGKLIANGWDEANKELHLYNLNGGMTLKLMETVPQSVQLQIAALGGDSTFGTATIAKNDVLGYFEQCDSTGNALDSSGQVMWFWVNDPEGAGDCHIAKGVLVGGANIAQYTFLGGGWWFAGSDNILTAEYGSFFPESSTIAGSIDSQYIVTPMDDSGDFYKIEIAYSANTSGSMVGMSIYLKRTSMNQSVQTYLSGKSQVVL